MSCSACWADTMSMVPLSKCALDHMVFFCTISFMWIVQVVVGYLAVIGPGDKNTDIVPHGFLEVGLSLLAILAGASMIVSGCPLFVS